MNNRPSTLVNNCPANKYLLAASVRIPNNGAHVGVYTSLQSGGLDVGSAAQQCIVPTQLVLAASNVFKPITALVLIIPLTKFVDH